MQNVETHFSPDEDLKAIFLDFIRGTKSQLRIAVYGMHLPELVEEIVTLKQKGVDVALVCDHTQARGTYERPEILQLREAGIPLYEGTSQKSRIMHHKYAVRDGEATLSGSWNFSQSATDESNYFDIIHDTDRATKFLAIWQEMADWIAQHDQRWNV